MRLLCSQLTAAQEAAKNEEPALDLSATFRESLRLSMTGAARLSCPLCQMYAVWHCYDSCSAAHHVHDCTQLPRHCLPMQYICQKHLALATLLPVRQQQL